MEANAVFNAYGCYYDLLYRDKDYAGEVTYIQGILARHGMHQGDLLEFGSGTGKHGGLLAKKGYRVHGIERSAEMVKQATSCDGFTCQQGDVCTVQMGRTYDAVLSLFHVASYQTSNSSVQSFFARASEHLNLGGLFVFDFWYTPAVYTQYPTVRVKRMSDEQVEIIRIAEPAVHPNENCVDVIYSIYVRELATGKVQTITETHLMRHFSLPEIDLLAEKYGFQRINAEEFMTGKPAGEGSWGICVILKRV